jgi:hypothetical protein
MILKFTSAIQRQHQFLNTFSCSLTQGIFWEPELFWGTLQCLCQGFSQVKAGGAGEQRRHVCVFIGCLAGPGQGQC